MSIKVSIIIPVYNGHKYLSDAIDSAINQTYRNIEVIVVNDGSRDDGKTRAVAKRYGSRIRYIEQENKGVAGALNTGLAAMSGDVFCWLSHDDVYRPNKIERQVDFFNRLDRDDVILFSNYALIDETGKVTGETAMERVIGDKPQLALLRGCINGCTVFVPKKIFDDLGSFDENLRYTQDYDMWKRMAARHSFVLMPEILVNYRMHSERGSLHPGATEEANELWIDLVDSTSLGDRVSIAGSSLRFFRSQAEFLAATPYQLATAHALKRAETCIKTTKVSVVIPFFNRIATAKRAILSAGAQTHQNLEIIAVDDGSTEDSAELDLMATADQRLRILRKRNGGPASARNEGMNVATGEYIAFLDSDDTWAADKISVQMGQMQEGGYLFSHTSYNLVHPRSNLGIATRSTGKLRGTIYPGVIGMCPIHTSTVMLHRRLFQDGYRFPEAFRIGEDCLLWIDIARQYSVLGIDVPLTTVEWSDASAAINLPRSVEGLRNIRGALLASKLHSEHAFEIAELTNALDCLERIHTKRRMKGTGDADVNVDLLLSAFMGSSLPALDFDEERRTKITISPQSSASLNRLRSRFHERATILKLRSIGWIKRTARDFLPRPVIEILKAFRVLDYKTVVGVSAWWIEKIKRRSFGNLGNVKQNPAQRFVTLRDHLLWVDQLRVAGKRSEFESAYHDILHRFAINPDAWLGVAIRANEDGRNDLAMSWLQEAVQLCNSATAQIYLGQVSRELGDYAQAESHYRAALLLDSAEPQAHVGLAIALGTRGAFTEAITHIKKATEYGLDPNYSKFLLAGAFLSIGRFEEADAIFSQNIAIALPSPLTTDTRILRFGNGYSEVMRQVSRTEPPLEGPLDVPEDGRAVYFLCCDGVYFERFIEAAINACIKNGGVDFIIHIHLINRLASAEAILCGLRDRLPRYRLRVTEETVDLGAFDEAERRTYYTCRRFYLLPELIRIYGRPILCADVDQLIMKSVHSLFDEMEGFDVGLLHDPLNAMNLTSYFSATAAFFAHTEAAFRFADRVRRYIDFFLTVECTPLWHLDQAALAVTYLNDPESVRLRRFPYSIVHSRPAGDNQLGEALFWSITYSVEKNAEKLQSFQFLEYA